MTSPAPAVTVGGLLKTRPEAFGLDLELLAGSGGLDRRITNPYVQKTGLALASTLLRPHVTFDAEARRRRGRRAFFRAAGMDDIDESEIDDVPETGEEP